MSFLDKFKKEKIEHANFIEGKLAFSNGVRLSRNPYGKDTHFYSEWASGWEEASQNRENWEKNKNFVDRGTVYLVGGIITGVIAFIACWIYAIASWGFLLGVGLGWIPSLFIAVIAGFIWPLVVLILIVIIVVITGIWKK